MNIKYIDKFSIFQFCNSSFFIAVIFYVLSVSSFHVLAMFLLGNREKEEGAKVH